MPPHPRHLKTGPAASAALLAVVALVGLTGLCLLHPEGWQNGRLLEGVRGGQRAAGATQGRQQDWGSTTSAGRELTRELVASVAQGGLVVITFANWGYRDFVLNWVSHIRTAQCEAFLVGATDERLLALLAGEGVPSFLVPGANVSSAAARWGSHAFHQMGRERVKLIHLVASMGFDVIFSDIDAVWLRNPLPFLQQFPEADVLVSSDVISPGPRPGQLMPLPSDQLPLGNVGVMRVRPSALPLVEEWEELLAADPKLWEQGVFNALMEQGGLQPIPGHPYSLFWGYNSTLRFGLLPVSTFCNGHTFFVQRMPHRLGLAPFVVHATHVFAGVAGKRHRLREALLWQDPPEYFRHPAGFITFQPSIPEGLVAAAAALDNNTRASLAATKPHFALVNHQLSQLRSLLALALALGRVAILPPLWCGMDRYWAPHPGKLRGAAMRLPFVCPADHVLELQMFTKQLPVEERVPTIEFREHSFLDNPRAGRLASRALTLHICQDGDDPNCLGALARAGPPAAAAAHYSRQPWAAVAQRRGRELWLPPHLSSNELVAALAPLAGDVEVLHVDGISRAFGGFSSAVDAERFAERLRALGGTWCCVKGGRNGSLPGHVHYDMLWDVVPHDDAWGRRWEGLWEPLRGP